MSTDYIDIFQHISDRVSEAVGTLVGNGLGEAIERISNAGKIFVYGAGRSGLVGRMFAMRIMHIGKQVHFVGDTTTPAINKGDLLMVISGSGKTQTALCVAQKAKEAGAEVLVICQRFQRRQNDHITFFADSVLIIDAPASGEQFSRLALDSHHEAVNPVPMGSIFELSTLLCVESIVGSIIRQKHIPEAHLKKRHANLE